MSSQLSSITSVIWTKRQWTSAFGLSLPLAISGSCFQLTTVIAQIVPDDTLGAEQSVLNLDSTWNDSPASLIEGGAVRGENLFHSFTEFNVGTLDWVYFAQPDTINRILTRVTGNNASLIDGTLGVAGNADLFVLNPNGILFGPNARLDIQGSFLASTADALDLGNGLEFNASNPQTPPLLTVDLPFQLNYSSGNNGVLSNQGQLTTGSNLTLAGQQVELRGTLEADGDINLLGNQTVQIRDTIEQPFRAIAQENLLIQGVQGVDIFALNHSDSWLAAGHDLTLRSDEAIIGDAHYWSGGDFAIENFIGNVAALLSPNDPIIIATGDVVLGDYTGASLHILAGGSVTLGNVEIDARGGINDTINPNHPDPFIASLANYVLSDGTSTVIDGSNSPTGEATLDIRAGIDWSNFPGFPGDLSIGIAPVPPAPNTSGDVTIGNVETLGLFREGGQVILSNQYFPNDLSGDISTGAINTNDFIGGGVVLIDSRDQIDIGENGLGYSILATPVTSDNDDFNGGDVRLIAADRINIDDQILVDGALGGNIDISAGAGLDLQTSLVSRSYTTVSNRQGGSINLTSPERITVRDGAEIITATEGTAQSGNIVVAASRLEIINPSNVLDTTALNTQTRDQGDAGNVTVNASEVLLDQGYIFSNTLGEGDAGDVVINGDRLTLQANPNRDNAAPFISVASQSPGNGGSITVNTPTGITELSGTDKTGLPSAFVFAGFDTGGPGSLEINSRELLVREGALISGTAYDGVIGNVNDAGSIEINSSELIEVSGSGPILPSSLVLETASDAVDGGVFNLSTQQFRVLDGGNVSAQSIGAANAGMLNVDAETIQVSGTSNGFRSRLFFDSQNSGQAGGIALQANQVSVSDGGLISVSGSGTGNSGDLSITSETVTLRNGGTISATTQAATGGNLTFNGQILILMECCNNEISAQAFNQANGGNITFNFDAEAGGLIISPGPLSHNNDVVANAENGNGGNITLNNYLGFFSQGEPVVLNFTRLDNGQRTPDSNFTARSVSGQDGEIRFNLRDNVDAEQLPEEFASEAVSDACTVGSVTSLAQLGDRPTFTIVSKGGLASNLTEPLSRDRPTVSLTPWPVASANRDADTTSTRPKPPHTQPLALSFPCPAP